MFLEPTFVFGPTQHPQCPRIVERDRDFQLRRPDGGIHLRRVNAGVSEKRPHLFQVPVLAQDFHRDPMPEIVRLQGGEADLRPVHLAQPPDVFSGHRGPGAADAALAPGRPEEGRGWGNRALLKRQHGLDVLPQEPHHRSGRGHVPHLSAFHLHVPQAPLAVELADPQTGTGVLTKYSDCQRMPFTHLSYLQLNAIQAFSSRSVGGYDDSRHHGGLL